MKAIIGLPHSEKQQWLLSIKVAWQQHYLARARMEQAQCLLLAQFLIP